MPIFYILKYTDNYDKTINNVLQLYLNLKFKEYRKVLSPQYQNERGVLSYLPVLREMFRRGSECWEGECTRVFSCLPLSFLPVTGTSE